MRTDDWNKRPLTGRDIEVFRQTRNIDIPAIADGMGIPASSWSKVINGPNPLTVPREILLRVLTVHPRRPDWYQISPTHGFASLYGESMLSFEKHGQVIFNAARFALQKRFAAVIGKTPGTGFRLLTGLRPPLKDSQRLFSILTDKDLINPREVVEFAADITWSCRNKGSLDDIAPMPDLHTLTLQVADQSRSGRDPKEIPPEIIEQIRKHVKALKGAAV